MPVPAVISLAVGCRCAGVAVLCYCTGVAVPCVGSGSEEDKGRAFLSQSDVNVGILRTKSDLMAALHFPGYGGAMTAWPCVSV